MTDKPAKPTLYLVISEEREYGYFHLYARVTTDRHENGERLPYGMSDSYGGPLYDGLRFGCQGDESSRKATAHGQAVYGYGRPEYHDRGRTELNDAKRMVKMLTSLERGLMKLTDTRGYARSYGEYLGRVAEVLGCKGMAFQRTAEQVVRCGYRWNWTTVGDGVNETNNRIYRWQQEVLEQTA